jgi:hypothetical protein
VNKIGMDEPAASTAGLVIQVAATTEGIGKDSERVAVTLTRSQALAHGCRNAEPT